MNGMNDALDGILSEEATKGFLLFLFSERVRHQKDIDEIDLIIRAIKTGLHLKQAEIEEIEYESRRYIDF